jgi:hypothetical protein
MLSGLVECICLSRAALSTQAEDRAQLPVGEGGDASILGGNTLVASPLPSAVMVLRCTRAMRWGVACCGGVLRVAVGCCSTSLPAGAVPARWCVCVCARARARTCACVCARVSVRRLT